jgi:DNA mismatch repair protein MSH4
MQAETRYDNARRYYLRVAESDFDGRAIPDILVNCFKKKGFIECQTLDLMKFNQRIEDSHQEIVLMSDKTVQELMDKIRGEIPTLFRVCESIAMLDMIAAFGHLATAGGDYVRPEIADCIAVKAGRHPVKEKVGELNLGFTDMYLTDSSRYIERSSFQMTYLHHSKSDFKS